VRRALLAAPIALTLAAAPAAQAANRATLDAHPATPGHVLMNPPGYEPGSALVAWTSGSSNTPKVCVIPFGGACAAPQTLRVPAGGGIDGLFPVATPNGAVALVGPRDEQKDVVRWTSQDGFGTPIVIAGSYPAMTTPQDVLTLAGDTLIGTVNPGLGIGGFGDDKGRLEFAAPGPDVKSASLGLDAGGKPVEAFFTLGGSLRVTRYSGGPRFDERDWTEPETIGTGTEPVLTGGPSGLFLASQDGNDLAVRKDDGTGFGAPRILGKDAGTELFDGGAATQSTSGRIAIVWPAHLGDGQKVLRAYMSSDGGETFAQSDVARIGDGYLVDRNASVGLANDGTAIATFIDGGGLEVADLSPLATTDPPNDPPPAPPAPPVPTPRPPRCVNAKVTGHLRGALVTLRATHLPAGVFVAQVSVRSRHRLRLLVRFRYDGRRVRARTRLSALVHARPGTHHVLLARVTARGLTRTLRLRLTGCAG
jgi:hypothetical protein